MSEQKSTSKLLKIIYLYALGSSIIYEILIILTSSINYTYFLIPGFLVAFFFSLYFIIRQKNLSKHPRPIRKKWYSTSPDGLQSSTIPKKHTNKDIVMQGLFIGFILIPIVILSITFLSIMTIFILLLCGIYYYLYFIRQKKKLLKKHEFLILLIVIVLSITPLILERTSIRKNYKYIEDYNIASGVQENVIAISESFNHHQQLNWSTILSYEDIVFPNERVLYKNRINDDKNQFFIPYLYSKESFKYHFSAKPITNPVIFNYTKDYSYLNYNVNEISFNISGDDIDENYFDHYCFCYLYLNSSHYNPPNNATESALFSLGFLVRIHMSYEHQFSLFDFIGEWEQEHIIILNDDYEILFALIIHSIVCYVDACGCGC